MTKQKRKEIYWTAMFVAVADGLDNAGICWLLWKATNNNDLYIRDFPELQQQRPATLEDSPYWWKRGRNMKARLECLSKAIDLCEE